jgi:basic membrane protein A
MAMMVTSTIKRLDKAVFSVIKSAVEAKFEGGTNYIATLENEGVGVGPFHDFEDKVPDEIKADLEQIQADIIAKKLWTGWGEPPEGVAVPAEKFQVAVVMPSAINDLAFSQSMYDALVAIQEEMGADNFEFAYSDGIFVVDDAAAAIRDYATQGYDLVIAHGSQYGSSLVEIAPDFPDTSFAWGTTVDTFTDQGINNVFAYEARSEEGGYVNGVIAASLSKSDVIGVIGPIETGDAKLYVDGFNAGVLATKPEATVNVNWTGSFSDVALASEAAQTHINAGADALTGSAQMVVGAVGVAEEKGVLWFGTQADQTSLAPDIVVACQVYDWTVALDQIIELIQGGTPGGQAFAIDLANGGLKIQYNPDYAVPDEVKTLADETIQGIVDGTITVLE